MKTKHAITLLVVGYCFDFVGALFKIMHYTNADTLLTLGAVLNVTGGLLFLSYPRFKNFIN